MYTYIYILIYICFKLRGKLYICEKTQQNLGEIDCIFNNNYNKQTIIKERQPHLYIMY